VKIIVLDDQEEGHPEWVDQLLVSFQNNQSSVLENDPTLREEGFQLGYALRREDKTYGVMLIDGAPASLTADNRAVLAVLANQITIAIEDSRLVQENVRLERQVAEGERLAALGQMAATVAHEIKNPLSAIKSIAQVMREDGELGVEYARDLSLIVGETDRLSQSVTQLLSFARRQTAEGVPMRVDELIRSVVSLFRVTADQQDVKFVTELESERELAGIAVHAVRDAFSNLLLNALQAVSRGGKISIAVSENTDGLFITVSDSGPGISPKLAERIWEPFFTTKQRGTGLGLAIVRKRMEEVGGAAQILEAHNGGGACFQLRLPLT